MFDAKFEDECYSAFGTRMLIYLLADPYNMYTCISLGNYHVKMHRLVLSH